MKAFSFRLEQALRWRDTQAAIQKARLAAALGRASEAQAALDSRKAELAGEARQAARDATGTTLGSYAAYARRSRAEIEELRKGSIAAELAARAERSGLVEADRGVRLLENLKEMEYLAWQRSVDREVSAFADEAYLLSKSRKTDSPGAAAAEVFAFHQGPRPAAFALPGRLQSKKPTGA